MKKNLLEKSDAELLTIHKNLKILLIISTIAFVILIGIVLYSLFVNNKPISAIMLGGVCLPYFLSITTYSKYEKEKRRRNL